MARKKKHEEHQNHEAWAIPYGDLVTLLLALFVVMYAMSSVNEGKFRVLSDSLIAAFRGAPATPDPIQVGEAARGKGGTRQLSGMSPTALLKLKDERPAVVKSQGEVGPGGGTGKEDIRTMASEVRAALQGLIDKNLVRVRQGENSLEVEIRADILFPSGSAQIDKEALPVLDRLAAIMKPFPNPIRVEGHSDNRPIATAMFPSNWELSAARAATVVQRLTKSGVEAKRLEVLGLGDNQPIASNDSQEGRNANRRVVVVVMQKNPTGEPRPAESEDDLAKTVAPAADGSATVFAPKPAEESPRP
jgi:chemotaxis protein MotB